MSAIFTITECNVYARRNCSFRELSAIIRLVGIYIFLFYAYTTRTAAILLLLFFFYYFMFYTCHDSGDSRHDTQIVRESFSYTLFRKERTRKTRTRTRDVVYAHVYKKYPVVNFLSLSYYGRCFIFLGGVLPERCKCSFSLLS